MVAKGNSLHRQFSFDDDDALANISFVQSHVDPSAAVVRTSALVSAATPAPDAHRRSPTGTVYGGSVADSGNQMLDGLIVGGKWDNSRPITYFFDDADSVSPWTNVEKVAFRGALQTWSDVANVKFLEVFDINAANLVDFKFQENPTNRSAFSELPNPTNVVYQGFNVSGGPPLDIPEWSKGSFKPGGFVFQVMAHELGHALGLGHTHGNVPGAAGFPGVDSPFFDYGDNDLNQGIFSIMTYNDGYGSRDGIIGAEYTTYAFGYSATPMPFDIAAVQFIYGANPHHNEGNDMYILPTDNSPGTYWVGIYDTGGIDEIKNPGNSPSTISLVAATIDDSPTGGGEPSYVENIFGGFTIAQNVVIENATGGGGTDTIIGNRADNVLDGNAGDDHLYGAGGRDWLFGGPGNDTIYGDAGPAEVSGVGLGSGQIADPTGNISFGSALDITNEFSLASNPDIVNSTTVPHVTISMTTAATGTVLDPWFAVTVNPNSTIYLDIDHTSNIDTFALLYGPDGRGLTFDDDSRVDPGSNLDYPGYSLDSALEIRAVSGGTYYIQVAYQGSLEVLPNNASFQLQVSVLDPPHERHGWHSRQGLPVGWQRRRQPFWWTR
jgi:Matrixin/RTX calcium-binding nonapeptide repeat (4 copies)